METHGYRRGYRTREKIDQPFEVTFFPTERYARQHCAVSTCFSVFKTEGVRARSPYRETRDRAAVEVNSMAGIGSNGPNRPLHVFSSICKRVEASFKRLRLTIG